TLVTGSLKSIHKHWSISFLPSFTRNKERRKGREISMSTNIASLVLNAGEGETTFEASGEYWIWKATGETTNGLFDQAITITLPQVGPPEHTHQQEELLYILEGTYRVKLGEHVFTASAGTSIRIPGGVS